MSHMISARLMQIVRQRPPLAASAQHIEDCIDDLAQALRRCARLRVAEQKRPYEIPYVDGFLLTRVLVSPMIGSLAPICPACCCGHT